HEPASASDRRRPQGRRAASRGTQGRDRLRALRPSWLVWWGPVGRGPGDRDICRSTPAGATRQIAGAGGAGTRQERERRGDGAEERRQPADRPGRRRGTLDRAAGQPDQAAARPADPAEGEHGHAAAGAVGPTPGADSRHERTAGLTSRPVWGGLGEATPPRPAQTSPALCSSSPGGPPHRRGDAVVPGRPDSRLTPWSAIAAPQPAPAPRRWASTDS